MLNIFRGFVLLLLSSMGVAHAADTGWLTSPQNDHARIRFQAERSEKPPLWVADRRAAIGMENLLAFAGEAGGVAPEIHWHNGEKAQWHLPVPSRFEISGLTTQGYHKQVVIPMIITGQQSDALDGTLTLSTCSNVCPLTDYPLHLDFSQPVDDHFQQAFEQAMRSIPAESGIPDDLSAHLAGSNLAVTGTTAGEWRDAQIYF